MSGTVTNLETANKMLEVYRKRITFTEKMLREEIAAIDKQIEEMQWKRAGVSEALGIFLKTKDIT